MKKVIMIILGISLFLEAEFYRDDTKGIITDSVTALQWQDDYTPNNPDIRRAEWVDAIDYCNNLVLGGYSDWRLPNINELSTLIIFKESSPSIGNEFVYIRSYKYWSSTTYQNSSGYAWFVDFGNGFVDNYVKYDDYYVRCVRAGQ